MDFSKFMGRTTIIYVLLDKVKMTKEVLHINGVDTNFINRLEIWKVRATLASGDDLENFQGKNCKLS